MSRRKVSVMVTDRELDAGRAVADSIVGHASDAAAVRVLIVLGLRVVGQWIASGMPPVVGVFDAAGSCIGCGRKPSECNCRVANAPLAQASKEGV